jgi:hypothetical protein
MILFGSIFHKPAEESRNYFTAGPRFWMNQVLAVSKVIFSYDTRNDNRKAFTRRLHLLEIVNSSTDAIYLKGHYLSNCKENDPNFSMERQVRVLVPRGSGIRSHGRNGNSECCLI